MEVARQKEELDRMETITEGIMILARCLWQILGTFWPNIITNEELFRKTDTISLATQIKRRWSCLGALVSNVTRNTAQVWPKETWLTNGEAERNSRNSQEEYRCIDQITSGNVKKQTFCFD